MPTALAVGLVLVLGLLAPSALPAASAASGEPRSPVAATPSAGRPEAGTRTPPARRTRIILAVLPRRPVAGEQLLARGAVGAPGRRPVRLQLRVTDAEGERRWRTVERVRSFPGGRFRVRLVMPGTPTSLRAVAPRTWVGGRPARREVSPARRLVPVPQTIDATFPALVVPGSEATIAGAATPARRGRLMGLQQRTVGGPWEFVSFDRQDRRGRFALDLPTEDAGLVEVRVVAGRFNGAPLVRTAPSEVEIGREGIEATLRVTRGAETTTDDGRPALSGRPEVVVRPAEPVSAVEMYVDAQPAGSATETEDGTWVWTWDTVRLADGPHDVVARLEKGVRRGVSQAVRVDTQQPASPAALTGLPEGFRAETLAAGLFLPTTFEVLDARRVLVAEKSGLVRLVEDGVVAPEPVIDISDHVLARDDVGLIAMTLAPDFDRRTTTGEVYLGYTYLEDPAQADRFEQTHRVTRVVLRDGVQAGAEEVVLGTPDVAACPVPETPGCLPFVGTGHAMGELLFDDRGALLVTVGDGALYAGQSPEAVRAQDLDVLAGKVLRVDPDTGLGLPDNPYYSGAGAASQNRDRIWAYGLRNPFRLGVDAEGDVILGDVGEDAAEELDRLERGANYGWPCVEADRPGPSFLREAGREPSCPSLAEPPEVPTAPTPPIHVYPHDPQAGGSVSGGVALAGAPAYPAAYRDRFLYSDYALGEMRLIDTASLDPTDDAAERAAYESFATREAVATPVRTRIGPDGTVWFLTIFPGELRRIVHDTDGATTCDLGTWRASWFADGELTGTPDAVTCEQTAEAFPRPPGIPDQGSAVSFEGRFRFAGGAYEFVATGAGPTRFVLDDEVVLDTFGVGGDSGERFVRTLVPGIHRARLDYVDERGIAASRATWEPTTAFPEVAVTVPDGTFHAPGDEVSWQVTATDAAGADIADSATTTLQILHYPGEVPHLHPAVREQGRTGSARLTQDHAEGRTAYRLTASVTDSAGHPATSAPVYLCLEGNAVGVCS
ncbi:PQQ-dependent sugar dehydrogenase [Nocardioidaceae bacterium]|nr:PQQ-dependent sugar dehydrogenase [Nocardioidaceae bacterium]